jgi:hypothetical protein
MKIKKPLALTSIILILTLSYVTLVRDRDANLTDINAGRKAFNMNCVNCHGINGSNQLKDLPISALKKILFGKNPDTLHLKFLELVESEDKQHILDYVRFEKENQVKP